MDKIAEGASCERPLDIIKSPTMIDHVTFFHQLFQSLGHRFGGLHVDLMAEPFRKGEKLAQFSAAVCQDVMGQQMQTINRVDNLLKIPRLEAQDMAELVEF